MAKYNIGDKVKTIDVWDNGFGKIIPAGSIVEILYDNGELCRCKWHNEEAWYEYRWLGDIVSDKYQEKQKELNDFIKKLSTSEYDCFTTDRDGILEILKRFQA